MSTTLLRICLTLGLGLAGCSASGTGAPQQPQPSPTATTTTPPPPGPAIGSVRPEPVAEIATDLAAPWSVARIDDDSALVSLRDSGEVLLLRRSQAGWNVARAGQVPAAVHSNEGGLLGLAIDPSGTQVYAMYTGRADNRVVRMSWDGNVLGPQQSVLTGVPKAEIHNGGRILFGPDGMLYIATGDAGQPERAQDPADLGGKILRIGPDGSVPADNPVPGSPVYSLGHRNIQGLAFDDNGQLWASEFGAKDYDEINRITPGGNYGWPEAEGPGGAPRFTDPQAWFSPTSTASPSGMAFARGSLWVASLRGQTLFEVPLRDGAAEAPLPHLVSDFGRLRDVVLGPGGSLWLLTNNTDGRGDPRTADDRIIELRLQLAS